MGVIDHFEGQLSGRKKGKTLPILQVFPLVPVQPDVCGLVGSLVEAGVGRVFL